MKQMMSPCESCRRVRDPRQCENKDCKTWRTWFIHRWDYIRRLYRQEADPCKGCSCPQELCFEPCARKSRWEEGRTCL